MFYAFTLSIIVAAIIWFIFGWLGISQTVTLSFVALSSFAIAVKYLFFTEDEEEQEQQVQSDS